jgi:hypothetical protein
MRAGMVILMGMMVLPSVLPADGPKDTDGPRFGVPLNLSDYPQGTPEQSLHSVLKAIESKRLDYLVAQLSDPAFIDRRVKLFGGRFQDQVDDTAARLDAGAVKLLTRYAKEGAWSKADKEAMVSLKDVNDRFVFFHKLGDRWYLDHRSKPDSKSAK